MDGLFNKLVREGMGFCCEWAFFQKYRRTGQIALRLGVSTSTVQEHKREWREGRSVCEGREECLKYKLPLPKT